MIEFSEPLKKALLSADLKKLTHVQDSLLPPAFERRDVLAIGTGKDGLLDAMAVILSARINRNTGKLVLALMNSAHEIRELSSKVAKILGDASILVELTLDSDFDAQEMALDCGARAILAEPARVIEHMKVGNVSLSSTEFLLVSPVDLLMSEKKHAAAMMELLRFMPRTRQTIAIGNLMGVELSKNITKILKDPVKVEISADAAGRMPPATQNPRKMTLKREPARQPKAEISRRPKKSEHNRNAIEA